MSVADFVANPHKYSKGHIVQFTHSAFQPAQAGMQVVATMNNWAGAWTAEHYGMIGGQYTSFSFQEAQKNTRDANGLLVTLTNQRIGKTAANMHTVNVGQGALDLGIRYLPWKANAVTYMSIDNAAKTFFTGPLSGCSIFIGTIGATYWVFHANRNSTGAPNPAIKAAMMNSVNITLPAQVQLVHQAIYGTDYTDFGFVFGQKSSGNWKFYAANTTSPAVNTFITTVRRLP